MGSFLSLTAPFSHATAHITLHGAELDLSAPCAQIKLAIDPALKDGIALEENDSASAAPQSSGTGPENRLSVSLPNCAKGNHVSLHLSPNTALTLHDSPHSHIIILGTLSSLESSLEDSHIEIDHVQSLDLSLKGTSTAIIHQLDRAAQIVENDTTSLLIDHGELSAFSAKLNGHSQLMMQQGHIESLILVASEETRAHIMAQSNAANLTTNDQAQVTIGQVTSLTHKGSAPLQEAPTVPTPTENSSTAPITQANTASSTPLPQQATPAAPITAQNNLTNHPTAPSSTAITPPTTPQTDGASEGLNTGAPSNMAQPAPPIVPVTQTPLAVPPASAQSSSQQKKEQPTQENTKKTETAPNKALTVAPISASPEKKISLPSSIQTGKPVETPTKIEETKK